MRFDVVTLFPQFIDTYLSQGVLSQGIKDGHFSVKVHNLRSYGRGNYQQVDDRTFGGGAGMLLMFEPIAKVLEDIHVEYTSTGITKFKTIATTATGEKYKQSHAKDLLNLEAITILCGRYEGFDQRILDELVDTEFSVGNYVLTGGELPALTILDSTARMIPGVLNNSESFQHDSFYEDDVTGQYPQYTRPEVINHKGKSLGVPSALVSGNHKDISLWRETHKISPKL